MEDLARLGLQIESGQVRSAVNDLNRLQTQSASLERQTQKTTTTFAGLNRVAGLVSATIGTIAASAVINQLSKYADTATKIDNAIRTVTTSTGELNRVQEELFNVANNTRTSFESTTELYSKLAKITSELGISQERLLRITETINKTFAASGADAAGSALR
jgi:chaperonin cofactor prefoldin